jgi:hypothetical protein
MALARARHADYRLVAAPAGRPPPPPSPAPGVAIEVSEFDVFAAPHRVFHGGRQVNSWLEMSFAPIVGRTATDGDFWRVQESARSPSYRVIAPHSAELLGGMVVRLGPSDPMPYFSPERLVSHALAGRLGLSMGAGSAGPPPMRPEPRPAGVVAKPDGLAVEDMTGQVLFSWAS